MRGGGSRHNALGMRLPYSTFAQSPSLASWSTLRIWIFGASFQMALFDHFWIDPISICLLLWVTYYSPPFQRAWFWKWPNRPSDRWWSVALGHNLWHGPATFDPLQGYPQDRFTAPSSSYDLFRNLSVLTKINCGRFKDRNVKWEHMDEWTRQTCSAYQTPVLVYQLTACTTRSMKPLLLQ